MAKTWWSAHRDQLLSAVVFLALAVPLVPVPGDGPARVNVRFQASGMSRPHSFHAQTKRSTCEVVAMVLAYDNPDTGEYTRITCGE